ncbi:efflux RND transporter periplasmic adaptor subunit [Halopseudomonas pelagia]|uniref:efflux RND transporter periplasmic adaptor subunit n=1 Tax=Halopseudomonas pelagia TaxID=553151 RepID=UPI0030D6D611|tara:strand:- start:735 stop:1943 length:1209 start_codon:yes stop_codon:yes gene_type:complete
MTMGRVWKGKWVFWAVFALLVAVVIVYSLRPEPVWVNLATVTRSPMEITILEEGKTRVKDHYVVSSPVTGYLNRVEWKVGDPLTRAELVAYVEPMPANVLDARSRAEAQARVEAARSALAAVRQKISAAKADAEYAESQYGRLRALEASGSIAAEQVQQAQSTALRTAAILRSAQFEQDVATHELAAARAFIEVSAAHAESATPAERVAVRSPVNGVVLDILRESEGVIQAGEAIVRVGDPGTLEIVVDVLSFDAVKLEPGIQTRLNGWGGATLQAVIRRVEPVGFEDVSALGVEEQRVKVIVDMLSPREQWNMLGDGYRVDAEFILWQSPDVLQVPASALFQHDGQPTVFLLEDQRATLQAVETGQSNGLATVVISGLEEGQTVVRHPGRELSDGDRIRVR